LKNNKNYFNKIKKISSNFSNQTDINNRRVKILKMRIVLVKTKINNNKNKVRKRKINFL